MPPMPPVKTAALEPPVNLSRVKGKLTNTLNNLTKGRVRYSGERRMKMKKKGKRQRRRQRKPRNPRAKRK